MACEVEGRWSCINLFGWVSVLNGFNKERRTIFSLTSSSLVGKGMAESDWQSELDVARQVLPFVYHEQQVAGLCAVHSINSLLQSKKVDEVSWVSNPNPKPCCKFFKCTEK